MLTAEKIEIRVPGMVADVLLDAMIADKHSMTLLFFDDRSSRGTLDLLLVGEQALELYVYIAVLADGGYCDNAGITALKDIDVQPTLRRGTKRIGEQLFGDAHLQRTARVLVEHCCTWDNHSYQLVGDAQALLTEWMRERA